VSENLDQFRAVMRGRLPELFGMELLEVERGRAVGRLELREEHMAPNDFLHAATVVAVADSCCGLGCRMSLPEGATSFTTVELKSNFLRSARADDALRCEASMAHGGRTTQVWDATVTRESDQKPIALFRCTQYLLRES
jgi:1,4-dihydroxy-2-naphthoyl-CoA hydrolase